MGGRSSERSFKQASEAHQVQVVGLQWFHWGTRTLEQEIDALISMGAQAMVLVANAPEGAEAALAMAKRAIDKRVPIYSHWGITGGISCKVWVYLS